MVPPNLVLPENYPELLQSLKFQIRNAQFQAQRAVNTGLIRLYWSIGNTILIQQERDGWGSGVVARLAADLQKEFPGMTGISRSSLNYMRAMAASWPEGDSIFQQAAGKLPWGHIMILIDKLEDQPSRNWYAAEAVTRGWSRNMLLNQIKNKTLERSGAAPSNFESSLDRADSELAQQIAKDPYVFDFLDLRGEAAERELERALTGRISETLHELGQGFAFVGRQVHFDVGGDDFYLDLLFFHIEQARYVVIELKTGKFEPGYAGQLGFYTALVDDRLRLEAHAPTVGILVCGSRNDHTVRYSLGRTDSPMAVSTYTYESLPPNEKSALPDADAIAAALDA
ncbi:PDDEXK nuclease domain-containing protein [Subtercola frigoramans]|uniref:Nuclease of restriction endonuclease-like (RecB) superfamily n=1 Tax=Subtercola frigoramans TaxID=120298 RepID=A0ABS2L936_9MICO|nr:PDDEXK nuclease domain-containing protein [Subtercola frigoramans]MBM7473612.1 putative nuclease of restriction endonuclease-like (RecB) superfamily [Subtercola frigoramans]